MLATTLNNWWRHTVSGVSNQYRSRYDCVRNRDHSWGAGLWGGTTAADPATTLNGALSADTNGTGGSGTSIVLTDASSFPSSGSIVVDEKEVISYTGKSSNTLTGITRGQDGSTPTAGTGVAHA